MTPEEKHEALREAHEGGNLFDSLCALGVKNSLAEKFTWEKESYLHNSLEQENMENLIMLLSAIAVIEHDGHFTILSFTNGYRVGLGTPDFDIGWGVSGPSENLSLGRQCVESVPEHQTLKFAIIRAITGKHAFETTK